MIVDPIVAKRKFDREVAAAKAHGPFQRQGIWILRAEFPVVFVVLVTNHPLPVLPGILCGVHLNFADYDVRPPSICLVDPFTEAPLSIHGAWTFPRALVKEDPVTQQTVTEIQQLLQAFDPDKPFFCIPGTREYHGCSAHSGDSWFLHRKPNMLIHLLTLLHRYGPNATQFYQILAPKVLQ